MISKTIPNSDFCKKLISNLNLEKYTIEWWLQEAVKGRGGMERGWVTRKWYNWKGEATSDVLTAVGDLQVTIFNYVFQNG